MQRDTLFLLIGIIATIVTFVVGIFITVALNSGVRRETSRQIKQIRHRAPDFLKSVFMPSAYRRERRQLARDRVATVLRFRHPFAFSLSRWNSIEERQRDLDADDPTCDVIDLLPEDGGRTLLVGEAGIGKTTVMGQLYKSACRLDTHLVFLLNLGRVRAVQFNNMTDEERLNTIVEDSAEPAPCQVWDIERALAGGPAVVLVDGLNEIPSAARTALTEGLDQLGRAVGQRPALVYSMRPETLESLSPIDGFYSVDPLAEDYVLRQYEARHGEGRYWTLSGLARELLARPFYLNLACKGADFSQPGAIHEMLLGFLSGVLKMSKVQIRRLSEVAFQFEAPDENRSIADLLRVRADWSDAATVALKGGGVLAEDGDWGHDNWRNILMAVYLAGKGRPAYDELDRATNFSAQRDVLQWATAIAWGQRSADELLSSVFDWSYPGALWCAKYAASLGDAEVPAVHMIYASVAAKRFDSFESTRAKAGYLLSGDGTPVLEPYASGSQDEILGTLSRLLGSSAPFDEWFALYSGEHGDLNAGEWVEAISSEDSLTGWAAANAAREPNALNTQDRKALREAYASVALAARPTVRWRIVHVLGAHPSPQTLDVLEAAADEAENHWVRYGSVRSIMEIGAKSDGMRARCLKSLVKVRKTLNERVPSDRAILDEMRNGLAIDGASGEWPAQLTKVIEG